MNAWLALVVAASIAASLFGYWRAFRLHRRIVAIEPAFRGLVTQLLDRLGVRRPSDPRRETRK